MRRPPVVLSMATITIGALLVAVLLILFSVNPSVDRNEGEIQKAVMSQHAIICAQVQNTANSYRFRSLTPSGKVEPIRHFLTRMQAQQQTLRLARGSECKSAPGFPPVGLQVRRALRQIHEILQHFEPRLREPVRHETPGSHKHPGFSPASVKPPNAGIDESGVPAVLGHSPLPGGHKQPQGGKQGKEGETAPPPPFAPGEAAPEEAQQPSLTRGGIQEPAVPLPSVPIPIETELEIGGSLGFEASPEANTPH